MKDLWGYEVIVTAKYRVKVMAENEEQAHDQAVNTFEDDGTLVSYEANVGKVSSHTTIEQVRRVG